MAIIDLSRGQLTYLKEMIISENPQLIDIDFDKYFNKVQSPELGADGKVTLRLTGRSGVGGEGGVGYFDFTYRRLDLNVYFMGIPPVVTVYQPTGLADILFALGDQYGVVITETMVEPLELTGPAGILELRFKTNFVIANDTFTIEYKEPELTHLEDVYRVTRLPGFDAPWPYPVTIDTIYGQLTLTGFEKPVLIWQLDEISEYWVADAQDVAMLSQLTVGGGYIAAELAVTVTRASSGRLGVWNCASGELPLNLWNSYIAYNDVPRTDTPFTKQFNRELSIRTSVGYLPQGRGEIHIYYNV